MKTLKTDKRKKHFRIPHSVQDIIPCTRIWKDGIVLTSEGSYSKSFLFNDIKDRNSVV